MKKKTWDIGKYIALITILSVGIALAGQIRENTAHRLTQLYFQRDNWIKNLELECGKEAVRCSREKQNMVRDWKLEMDNIHKKIFK